ncbi:putative extensin-2-like [Iris pallida]|uniref:Extensin-2-like n=1 Tax=Iris pallida TaxID=29817 RepID=A0AAX6EWU5_IRIPA|nr:putative extensin-2-like [Iris pallida]
MTTMMKFFLLLLLPLLALTRIAGEETFELHHLLQPAAPPTLAVSLADQHLLPVSATVLSAERWLRAHVLAHYPSANITTILLGTPTTATPQWSLLLPAAKNLRHSLARWSLLGDIRLSAAFSPRCFDDPSRADALRPLLRFMQGSGMPYTIYSYAAAHETAASSLASLHRSSLERMGFPRFTDVRIARALASPSPSLRSRNKRPFAPAPRGSFSFAPASPPATVPPPSPPDLPADPPVPFCIPPAAGEAPAPAPGAGGAGEKVALWCVAKPTVPEDKLQEAMDFACGAGGADCEQIRPNGDCFNPDNLVAHASYAFNSYWQKTKQTGGSCHFDGTALLINSDPSFLQCRFELS